jgi:hypothetical protein
VMGVFPAAGSGLGGVEELGLRSVRRQFHDIEVIVSLQRVVEARPTRLSKRFLWPASCHPRGIRPPHR